jgi:hypothetical protein
MRPRSRAGFAGAIPVLGAGTEERAVRRTARVGRGAQLPSEEEREVTL